MDTNLDEGQWHFAVCNCGRHGRIILSDGRASGEFGSKEGAELALHYADMVHRFQAVDIFPKGKLRHIQSEIRASSLPEKDADLSDHEVKLLQTWNAAKLFEARIDPADFHKVAEKLWGYREFDD